MLREALPFNALLTLAFSAKESLFKTLYPQVRCYFDFLDARMTAVDVQRQTFVLELLKTLTPHCPADRRFSGRFGVKVTTSRPLFLLKHNNNSVLFISVP